MKKTFFLAAASLMLLSCSQKSNSATETEEPATAITWIEDKPGPTLQGTQIFPSVPDSLWEALGLQEGVPSSISCFLLQAGGETILLDAGLGAPFSQLVPKLAEAGVQPDQLHLIYLTHLHPDHIGGMMADGQVTFPNAEVYVNRIEAEAWMAMDNELPKAVLGAYQEHLHLFEAGDTLAGGVATIAAYGHTPGHTLFQKDSLLVIGDLMHGAALQMSHPEYCPFFDMDPEAATEARLRILDYAREHHLTMYGMHLPEPGFITND